MNFVKQELTKLLVKQGPRERIAAAIAVLYFVAMGAETEEMVRTMLPLTVLVTRRKWTAVFATALFAVARKLVMVVNVPVRGLLKGKQEESSMTSSWLVVVKTAVKRVSTDIFYFRLAVRH